MHGLNLVVAQKNSFSFCFLVNRRREIFFLSFFNFFPDQYRNTFIFYFLDSTRLKELTNIRNIISNIERILRIKRIFINLFMI